MTSSLKPFCAASLLSLLLAACGGGSSSGAPEQSLAQQSTEQPAGSSITEETAAPVETANPQATEKPQESVAQTPAVPGQTGWTVGLVETRNPLDLLKSAVCVARARMEMIPSPRSSAECSTTFPDLVSGSELSLPGFNIPAEMTEQREGCTFVAAQPALLCSWKFSKQDPSSSDGRVVNYWLALPFMPTFSTDIASCASGKDHFALEVNRVGAASGPITKAPPPPLPVGCVGWEGLTEYFEATEVLNLQSDVPN